MIQAVTSKSKEIGTRNESEMWAEPGSVNQELDP